MRKFSSICILSLILLVAGCMSSSSNPDKIGYQDGRNVAVLYMATEGVQPSEVREASKVGYAILTKVCKEYNVVDVSNDVVEKLIDKYISDNTTPEGRQLVLNFYNMARNRLLTKLSMDVFEEENKSTLLLYLTNFQSGVEDALTDYGYEQSKK